MYASEKIEITSVLPEPILGKFYLKLDQTKKIFIKKKFKYVLTILGKMGGLTQGLLILLFIIVYPVREVLYYRKLINENFHVCVKRSDVREAMGLPMLKH